MDTTLTSPVENSIQSENKIDLEFKGQGGEYFTIVIVNWLLTVITLGLYYPWAKARKLQYLYNTTEFNKIPFVFHGTGKEMFKGFIKAVIFFILIYGIFIVLISTNHPILAVLEIYGGILALVPLAIHGSYKYRMSRTSWSGIKFGYRGDRSELFKLFFKGVLLTIVTLGIYGAWLSMNLRNYVLNRVRFGSLKFTYFATGSDYFFLNLKGYILSILTLGIYIFWWQKELYDFYVNNLGLTDENHEKKIKLRNTATGSQFAGLMIVNILIFIFTLGLGFPWVICRTLRFLFSHVEIIGDIDLLAINQTETDYKDATGEDISDMLDFGFVI